MHQVTTCIAKNYILSKKRLNLLYTDYVYGSGADQDEIPNSRYIGCYKDDTSKRALPYGPHDYGYTPESCAIACKDYKYFGLQNGGWCCCENELEDATRYGPSTDCPEETRLGGSLANDLFENLDYCMYHVSIYIF